MQLNKRTIKIVLGVIAFGVGLAWLLNNLAAAASGLAFVWGLVWPFVLGLIFAFLLNIPMRFLERVIFRGKGGRARRPVSFVLTLVLVLAVLALVIMLVIPQLVQTIILLVKSMPGYFENIQKTLQPYEQYVPYLQEIINNLNLDWSTLGPKLMEYVQSGAGTVFSSAWGFASSLVSGTVSFFIGFIFACYVLLDKERLHRQFTGLMRAYIKEPLYNKFLDIARLVDKTFSQFVSGQCIEAVVIGSIFCLLLLVFGFDYAMLIGVLIGFMSFIPIFGATIACVVGALLILISQGFWHAFFFVVLFLVVQQIDGNFIYPHIVGSSTGLPPIWVLVAVTLGGSLMGMFGMILFIPLVSVIYTLLRRITKQRLADKGIPPEEYEAPPTDKRPRRTRKKNNKPSLAERAANAAEEEYHKLAAETSSTPAEPSATPTEETTPPTEKPTPAPTQQGKRKPPAKRK